MTCFVAITKYLYLVSILWQTIDSQQFCNISAKNNLLSGAMNYYETHYLLFRDKQVWRSEYNTAIKRFAQPVLVNNFVGSKPEDQNVGELLRAGFTLSKCSLGSQRECDRMLNISIFFYSNIYRLFKLNSNLEFEDIKENIDFIPSYWKVKGEMGSRESPHVLGAALINKVYKDMEIFIICSENNSTYRLSFNSTAFKANDLKTNQSFERAGGGFAFNGLPHFIIDNYIYRFKENQKQFENTTIDCWHFFHCDFHIKITPTQTTGSTTRTTPSITPTITSSKTETNSSSESETTSFGTTDEPFLRKYLLIIGSVMIIAIIVLFSCIITSTICWYRSKRPKVDNISKEEKLSKAKQMIKERKSAKKKIVIK